MVGSLARMRFAPQDVAFVVDPYPVYEELRASAPATYTRRPISGS